MTDDEIRIAIGEDQGWVLKWQNEGGAPLLDAKPKGHSWEVWVPPQSDKRSWRRMFQQENVFPPDYPNNLNACSEFERTLTYDEETRYVVHLFRICGWNINHADDRLCVGNARKPVSATARQRCEAYLKTKGLWK